MLTFFERLPEKTKEQLLRTARRRRFADGAPIQNRERPLRRICVIAEGQVRFTNVMLDGTEIDTIYLKPGQSFGEITTFTGRPPPHDAYAVGGVCLDIVEGSALESILQGEHLITEILLKVMGSMLFEALEALDDFRSLPPLALVAKHLLHSTASAIESSR